MTFGLPHALLLLFAAVPAILILHTLRPRGVRVGTTTLFLWERVLRERQMGQWLGRLLKKNLPLLLQLLAAIAVIAALADPRLTWLGAAAGDTIVVVDQSASMKAKGRSGARFDDARAELLKLIDALPSGGHMMIIGAGPRPEILASWSDDRARLRTIARALRATDAAAPVKEAVLFAHSFLKRGGGDRVVVVSDGAFAGAEDLPWGAGHLALAQVGAGGENVGITAFELRRLPGAAERHEAMVAVKNYTAHAVSAPLTIAAPGENWAEETVALAAGESRVLVAAHEGALPERLEARLDVADDFPTDNRAYLAVRGAAPLRVLYVGRGNTYLDRLFLSMPFVQVTRAERLETVNPRTFDAVVLDGIAPPALAEGNFIVIHAAPKPFEARGKIARPRLLPAAAHHAIADGVALGDLAVNEALRLAAPSDAQVLARAPEGPLVFAVERPGLKALVIGFDLRASDLPWRVAFPVLFSNAFEWFRPRGAEFPGARLEAGKPYAIPLAAGDDRVEVMRPSGTRETLRAGASPLPFTDTIEAGFYRYKTPSGSGEFAVNLLSETESDIRPRVAPQAAASTVRGENTAAETGLSLWPVLLAIALAALGVEAWLVFTGGAAFYPLALRCAAAATMLFALWNPKLFHAAQALDVILAVDASRSVGQEGNERALEILQEARRVKAADARAGLLFFGRRPSWEFFPRSDPPLADFSPDVGREDTDIESALEAPAAQIGAGREGKILLISDGNQTRGEVARALPFLRSHGIAVSVLPVSLAAGKNEVYVSDLVLPQQAESGATFEIKGSIESLTEANAEVKLLRDGVIRSDRTLRLRPGANWIAFKENLAEPGSHTYELWVESKADTLAENNRLQGVVDIKGPPRALYIADGRRAFAAALTAQGYDVVAATPEKSPLALGELASFDLVVLDNVPAYRLTQAKMETVERYVRDLGGGLVVLGGPQSYGAGGYYRTPLERILPLEMRPPSRIEMPHVALLFVLDKSGSMASGPEGATKLDLAKAAALAAADLLNERDQVGILTFDASWNWLLPFRAVGKGEWISERLAEVQSDGGTDMYKAMVEAERALAEKPASIKHLLILSDGLTDKAEFPALVAKMAREGITVSTVAIGQDADLSLMAAIARDGKGRGYAAIDPQTVPQIFTTETLLISRDLLVEKTVRPKMNAAMGALKGFAPERLPPLLGYVLTHPKPNAELLMQAGDDPLLVSWRFGLGKVVAFTSDLTGRWGREWIAWRDFPQWAGQLARSARRAPAAHRIAAEFRQEGDEIKAVVDLLTPEGGFADALQLKANVSASGRATSAAPFRQVAPGRYEARLDAAQRGSYLLTLQEEKKDAPPAALATVPFIVPYPREYRELKPNTALLSRIAEETGGEMLRADQLEPAVKRLFTPHPAKATAARAVWQPLAGLGLLLFLADLAARRWPGLASRRRQRFAEAAAIT
jgi:Ca-activated chloride channel homolog